MDKTEKYLYIVIGITVLVFVSLFAYGYYMQEITPYEITEIVCGTVESVEGYTIHFKNDSYSGIVKDDGSIRWSGARWMKNQWVGKLSIDSLNGFDISNLTDKYIEIRIHSVMDENESLISKIISIDYM